MSRYSQVVLKALWFFIFVAGATTISWKKPIGPELCKNLCNQLIGCSSVIYVTSNLSCHLDTAGIKKDCNEQNCIQITKTTERRIGVHGKTCPKHARIFYSNKGTLRCRVVSDNRKHGTGKLTRLLIVYSNTKEATLFHPTHNTTEPYPFFKARVLSIAFLTLSRKLIVGYKDKTLQLLSLDGHTSSIIKERIWIQGIALDEPKNIVFLTHDENCASRMTSSGKKFKTFIHLRRKTTTFRIQVDAKRSTIYILAYYTQYKIKQYTYYGRCLGIVVPYCTSNMFLDSDHDRLYYTVRSGVSSIALSDKTKRSELWKRKIETITFVENLIYSVKDSSVIYSVKKRKGKIMFDAGKEVYFIYPVN